MMKISLIKNWIDEFEENIYIPLAVIFQSCLGSIAAMAILAKGTTLVSGIELSLCVIVCMFFNAALLAQLKAKWCIWMLIISIVVNIFLLIINLL